MMLAATSTGWVLLGLLGCVMFFISGALLLAFAIRLLLDDHHEHRADHDERRAADNFRPSGHVENVTYQGGPRW